jgi:hypothetical protein
MKSVHTLFGTLDEKQLKTLKGAIDEIVIRMTEMETSKVAIKEIIDVAYDNVKVPKKILRKMAKVQYKQSLSTEIAEFKELEALIEGITEVK